MLIFIPTAYSLPSKPVPLTFTHTPCTDGAFGGVPSWQVLVAIGATLGAVSYIGILAKKALAEVDVEEDVQ